MSIARTAALSLAAASLLVSSAALAERQVGVDVNVQIGAGAQPAPPPAAPAPGPVYAPPPAPGPVYSSTPAPVAGEPGWVPPPPPRRMEYEHKSLTLDINPFALLIGRVGPNVQILPTPHHALVINPFWVVTADRAIRFRSETSYNGSTTTTTTDSEARYGGYGAEIGYRFYTASVSAQGFYIGPSIIFAQYSSSESDGAGGTLKTNPKQLGWALDAGFQKVFWSGFTIGAGLGLQVTQVDKGLQQSHPNTYKALNGVLPRFLFALGWSY